MPAAKPKDKAAAPKPARKVLTSLVGSDGTCCTALLVGTKVKARWQASPKPLPAVGALEAGKYAGGVVTSVDLVNQHADILYLDGLTESAVLFVNIRLWI